MVVKEVRILGVSGRPRKDANVDQLLQTAMKVATKTHDTLRTPIRGSPPSGFG